jgi:Protein of unknown function (DUF1592)/Protein of unknown function (DUF1588)/Protein of unknown function (DUF1585)
MTKMRVVLGLLIALALSVGVVAQSAQELYQRGLVQEHAHGDLKQAIALYAQAAQAAGKDRALAAKALIRMAGSQEKLGADAEAASTYAGVVRAYPEQRAEVAIAQDRLTALRRSSRADIADGEALAVERAADDELAVRLAKFIWNGVPDAPLVEAARRGDLDDATALNREVRRMLRDERSVNLVDSFFTSWLALDRLKTAQPDPSLFPQFDAELRQAMDTETRLFLESQLREDRDAVELWTADYTYVNERLARHYGLSGVSGREFKRVTWPNTNRAGLLGQAGPLTALSSGARTSPTKRGLYLWTRFLGMEAPSPPANVPALAEGPGTPPDTMRGRMMVHKTNPSCASCHGRFDPLGLALENFDAIGAWRTTDGGSPIDASGTLMDGTRFNGPAELRAGLLKYREAYYTSVTQQLLAYALNRKGEAGRIYDYEMPAVRKVVRDAAAQGYRWSSILAGIAASAPFQMKNLVP